MAGNPSCCTRFRGEFGQPFFSLDEYGKKIDVASSFGPSDPLSRLGKLVTWGWSVSTLIYSWSDSHYPGFFLAYVTNWSLIISCFYLTCSFLLSIFVPSSDREHPSLLVKLTWALYSLAATAEIVVVILYWYLVYEPGDLSYSSVMTHAVVAFLVLVDGNIINRIPMRVKHLAIPMVYALCYFIWTLIHSQTKIGNPDKTYDAIYESLDWKNDAAGAAVVAVLSILLLLPLVFFFLWTLSVYSFPFSFDGSGRRYVEESSDNDEREEPGGQAGTSGEGGDIEMPSVTTY